MDLIREVTQEYLKSDIPDFRPGDNVKVHVRLKEGEKERIQVFRGTVIARKGGGFIAEVKARADVKTFEVTRANRDGLADEIISQLYP